MFNVNVLRLIRHILAKKNKAEALQFKIFNLNLMRLVDDTAVNLSSSHS